MFGAMKCAFVISIGLVFAGAVRAEPSAQACGVAIAAVERAQRTAPGLLAAIGLVESGRRDPQTGVRAPWPWTVTAEGVGTYYPDQAEAVRAVQSLQARGVASIDVGCMQVNLLHHPGAFPDLATAFDPLSNVRYAARFLLGLYGRLGSWPGAAAAYHSMTPELGTQYGRLIAAVWSGGALPIASDPSGGDVVTFPGGGRLRLTRDAVAGPGRVFGVLTGP